MDEESDVETDRENDGERDGVPLLREYDDDGDVEVLKESVWDSDCVVVSVPETLLLMEFDAELDSDEVEERVDVGNDQHPSALVMH